MPTKRLLKKAPTVNTSVSDREIMEGILKTLQDVVNALTDLTAAIVSLGNNVQPPVDLTGVVATITGLTAQVQAMIAKITPPAPPAA